MVKKIINYINLYFRYSFSYNINQQKDITLIFQHKIEKKFETNFKTPFVLVITTISYYIYLVP